MVTRLIQDLPAWASFLISTSILAIGLACGSADGDPAAQFAASPAALSPTAVVAPTRVPTAVAPTPIPPPVEPSPTPIPIPSTPEPTATPTQPRVAPTSTLTPSLPDPTPTSLPTPLTQTLLPTPVAPDVIGLEPPGLIPAPAPVGLDGWINSDPLTVSDFADKIVLLDFWTYTCVNCIRTLPYLRDWHQKYADQGLLIIGVHTPEFDFEKLHENVATAVAELGIEYAVAQDNDRGTWGTYRVQAWPTKYIVDGEGFVRYYYRGEGGYADTELVIRYLLEEMGRDVSHIDPNSDPDPVPIAGTRATDMEKFLTRELYAGTFRNIDFGGAYILNEEYYKSPNVVQEYTDPGERKNHFLFIQGEWLNTPESLDHAGTSADYEDYVGFRFFASEVNAVLNHDQGEPYNFRVTMDGGSVPEESAGADIQYDGEGNSFVTVDAPRMYRLISQTDVTSHELLIRPADDSFSVYAFTFGAYGQDDG